MGCCIQRLAQNYHFLSSKLLLLGESISTGPLETGLHATCGWSNTPQWYESGCRYTNATDWLDALIGPLVVFAWFLRYNVYYLQVVGEKLLTQNLDVKTWRVGHFPVNRWRCSKPILCYYLAPYMCMDHGLLLVVTSVVGSLTSVLVFLVFIYLI
jgi:hypothetical protein